MIGGVNPGVYVFCRKETARAQNRELDARDSAACARFVHVGVRAFSDQDVPVIEAQQISLDQPDEKPAQTLLSVDTGPLQYQKVLDRLLVEELP